MDTNYVCSMWAVLLLVVCAVARSPDDAITVVPPNKFITPAHVGFLHPEGEIPDRMVIHHERVSRDMIGPMLLRLQFQEATSDPSKFHNPGDKTVPVHVIRSSDPVPVVSHRMFRGPTQAANRYGTQTWLNYYHNETRIKTVNGRATGTVYMGPWKYSAFVQPDATVKPQNEELAYTHRKHPEYTQCVSKTFLNNLELYTIAPTGTFDGWPFGAAEGNPANTPSTVTTGEALEPCTLSLECDGLDMRPGALMWKEDMVRGSDSLHRTGVMAVPDKVPVGCFLNSLDGRLSTHCQSLAGVQGSDTKNPTFNPAGVDATNTTNNRNPDALCTNLGESKSEAQQYVHVKYSGIWPDYDLVEVTRDGLLFINTSYAGHVGESGAPGAVHGGLRTAGTLLLPWDVTVFEEVSADLNDNIPMGVSYPTEFENRHVVAHASIGCFGVPYYEANRYGLVQQNYDVYAKYPSFPIHPPTPVHSTYTTWLVSRFTNKREQGDTNSRLDWPYLNPPSTLYDSWNHAITDSDYDPNGWNFCAKYGDDHGGSCASYGYDYHYLKDSDELQMNPMTFVMSAFYANPKEYHKNPGVYIIDSFVQLVQNMYDNIMAEIMHRALTVCKEPGNEGCNQRGAYLVPTYSDIHMARNKDLTENPYSEFLALFWRPSGSEDPTAGTPFSYCYKASEAEPGCMSSLRSLHEAAFLRAERLRNIWQGRALESTHESYSVSQHLDIHREHVTFYYITENNDDNNDMYWYGDYTDSVAYMFGYMKDDPRKVPLWNYLDFWVDRYNLCVRAIKANPRRRAFQSKEALDAYGFLAAGIYNNAGATAFEVPLTERGWIYNIVYELEQMNDWYKTLTSPAHGTTLEQAFTYGGAVHEDYLDASRVTGGDGDCKMYMADTSSMTDAGGGVMIPSNMYQVLKDMNDLQASVRNYNETEADVIRDKWFQLYTVLYGDDATEMPTPAPTGAPTTSPTASPTASPTGGVPARRRRSAAEVLDEHLRMRRGLNVHLGGVHIAIGNTFEGVSQEFVETTMNHIREINKAGTITSMNAMESLSTLLSDAIDANELAYDELQDNTETMYNTFATIMEANAEARSEFTAALAEFMSKTTKALGNDVMLANEVAVLILDRWFYTLMDLNRGAWPHPDVVGYNSPYDLHSPNTLAQMRVKGLRPWFRDECRRIISDSSESDVDYGAWSVYPPAMCEYLGVYFRCTKFPTYSTTDDEVPLLNDTNLECIMSTAWYNPKRPRLEVTTLENLASIPVGMDVKSPGEYKRVRLPAIEPVYVLVNATHASETHALMVARDTEQVMNALPSTQLGAPKRFAGYDFSFLHGGKKSVTVTREHKEEGLALNRHSSGFRPDNRLDTLLARLGMNLTISGRLAFMHPSRPLPSLPLECTNTEPDADAHHQADCDYLGVYFRQVGCTVFVAHCPNCVIRNQSRFDNRDVYKFPASLPAAALFDLPINDPLTLHIPRRESVVLTEWPLQCHLRGSVREQVLSELFKRASQVRAIEDQKETSYQNLMREVNEIQKNTLEPVYGLNFSMEVPRTFADMDAARDKTLSDLAAIDEILTKLSQDLDKLDQDRLPLRTDNAAAAQKGCGYDMPASIFLCGTWAWAGHMLISIVVLGAFILLVMWVYRISHAVVGSTRSHKD